jgi:hypothetical protein
LFLTDNISVFYIRFPFGRSFARGISVKEKNYESESIHNKIAGSPSKSTGSGLSEKSAVDGGDPSVKRNFTG